MLAANGSEHRHCSSRLRFGGGIALVRFGAVARAAANTMPIFADAEPPRSAKGSQFDHVMTDLVASSAPPVPNFVSRTRPASGRAPSLTTSS